jgi:hypothetical protein
MEKPFVVRFSKSRTFLGEWHQKRKEHRCSSAPPLLSGVGNDITDSSIAK